MYKNILLTGLIVALALAGLVAQPETVPAAAVNQPPSEVNMPPVSSEFVPTKTEQEVYLSIGVLLFGVVVIIVQGMLLWRREDVLGESFKYLSISLIIVGSLFLVTAGYGNTQIAPIIGLLGTVAGYLLGRQSEGVKK